MADTTMVVAAKAVVAGAWGRDASGAGLARLKPVMLAVACAGLLSLVAGCESAAEARVRESGVRETPGRGTFISDAHPVEHSHGQRPHHRSAGMFEGGRSGGPHASGETQPADAPAPAVSADAYADQAAAAHMAGDYERASGLWRRAIAASGHDAERTPRLYMRLARSRARARDTAGAAAAVRDAVASGMEPDVALVLATEETDFVRIQEAAAWVGLRAELEAASRELHARRSAGDDGTADDGSGEGASDGETR